MVGMKSPFPKRADFYEILQFAVAVPLVWHEGQWQLLFELRNKALRRNPGEVSFPGGRIDAGDADSLAAALREMREELGVDTREWQVLGALPYAYTRNSRLVAPYVVLKENLPPLTLERAETTEAFTIPFDWFYTTQPQRVVMWEGVHPGEHFPYDKVPHFRPGWSKRLTYELFFYEYEQRVIWGLTARIIQSLLAICKAAGYTPGFDFSKWGK